MTPPHLSGRRVIRRRFDLAQLYQRFVGPVVQQPAARRVDVVANRLGQEVVAVLQPLLRPVGAQHAGLVQHADCGSEAFGVQVDDALHHRNRYPVAHGYPGCDRSGAEVHLGGLVGGLQRARVVVHQWQPDVTFQAQPKISAECA